MHNYINPRSFFNFSEVNFSLIQKFQINFKLSKFYKEEGKEKIMKKIRELFDRNNIFYVDQLIEDIFFNNGNMNSPPKMKTSRPHSKPYSYSFSTLSISHTNQFFYHPEIPQDKDEGSFKNSQQRNFAGRNISLAHPRLQSQFFIIDENRFFVPIKGKIYFQYKKCN